ATRKAAVAHANCHPFKGGHLLFMHNGYVPAFHRLKRRLVNMLREDLFQGLQGTTDSEHAFALLLNHLDGTSGPFEPDQLKEAMRATVALLSRWTEEMALEVGCNLNFALSDGHTLLATRYSSRAHPPSLYCATGVSARLEGGHLRLQPGPTRVVILGSEPLSRFPEEWRPVDPNRLIVVHPDLSLEEEAL
ncbi:MAG: class II glutamine amidotransferase, partial [Candidatus Eremiobacterota bacterium]